MSSMAGKPPSKFWRLKYRLHGKENRFSIGAYPDIGLKEARDIARGARRDVSNHIAPLKAKTAKFEAQLLNEERTFEYVAKQWLAIEREVATTHMVLANGTATDHTNIKDHFWDSVHLRRIEKPLGRLLADGLFKGVDRCTNTRVYAHGQVFHL